MHRTGTDHDHRRGAALAVLLTAQVALAIGAGEPAAAAANTDRASLVGSVQQGSATLEPPAISADSRFVAFSATSDLLRNGARGEQVYLRDRSTRTTTLVSVRSGGGLAGAGSERPAMSDDARFVAFSSFAGDLVSGDTNGVSDVFVHDRSTRATSRVSVSSGGVQGNGASFEPSVSADGRFVAFESDAATLVNGDTNGVRDVFVHDRLTGLTSRQSRSAAGVQGDAKSENPSITADGSAVAFQSAASNLVVGDTGGVTDVFVRRLSGSIVRVSVSSGGGGGNDGSLDPAISADGTAVAFESRASNLTPGLTPGRRNVFHHDIATRRTTRAVTGLSGTEGNADSREPSISANGRRIAFKSFASNLVFSDGNGAQQDVFVADLDRPAGFQNTLASVSTTASGGNGTSTTGVLTRDGRAVAFTSLASNLVAGDTNGVADAFVRTLQ